MRKGGLAEVVVLFACVAFWVVGCGGSGGDLPTTTGLSGRVTGAGSPEALTLAVDGQQLKIRPQADGSFTILGLPPGEHVLSVIGPDGSVGTHITIEVDETGAADVGDIDLEAGGQIVGLVAKVEDDGALTPLEGIQVTATVPEVWILDGDHPLPEIWPPPDDRPSDLKVVGFTDADGNYTLEAVPSGEYEVRVVVPGFEVGVQWVYVAPGSSATANFHLREAIDPGIGSVEGKITSSEDGEAIPGAVVSISATQPYVPVVAPDMAIPGRSPDAGPVEPWFDWYTFMTLTDPHGEYHLNVPSGYMSVSVFAEGFDPVWRDVTLRPDRTLTLNIALEPMPGWPPDDPYPPPLPPGYPEHPPGS